MKRVFPKFLVILIMAIAVVNALAHVFYLYWRLPWFDIPMHFAGGVWVAGTASWLWLSRRTPSLVSPTVKELIILPLCAVLVVSALWELFEFGTGAFFAVSPRDVLWDTVGDTLFASMGSMFVSWYHIRKREKFM